MAATRYVILGNSAAGLSAIDAIRQRDQDGPITVVSKEPEPTYSRVALPYVLSREKKLGQISLQEPSYYTANAAMLISGVGAYRLNGDNRTVHLEDGRTVQYDKLLIATGSVSRVPPVRGIEEADVCYHWTLADTRRIAEQTESAASCFVIGAGFISLLTLSALVKVARLKFTVVEIAGQVMPQLLDREGGHALERAMRDKGIDVILGDQVSAIERARDGGYGITLNSGKTYYADMIVCGTGVRPNIDFLKSSGLEIDNGILTNERQETNLPGVYAAGDCAEGFDFLTGERAVHAIWPTAVDQGRVAGANMAGDSQTYPGSLSWNVTELFGLASASIGEFRERDGWEPIVFHNPHTNVYRKLLLDGGRIVGAVVIGQAEHVQDLGVVQAMIRRRTDVSRWKQMLHGERINYGMLAFESAKR
ncbi:MAG: NAD(P)/FAD-dependent oxidoreductase [Chloroflexi bacterium]|nr:NAD(P)/FAD-dependent oxidoreductase [Chloroflexota bacterium]